MSAIAFDFTTVPSDKTEGTLTADKGTFTSPNWSGSASKVTFTVKTESKAQKWILGLTVTYGEGGSTGGESGGGSTGGNTGGDTTAKTAASVTADFNKNLSDASAGVSAEWDSEYQDYELFVDIEESTDTGEDNLADGAYTLAYYLPDYMGLLTEFYGDPTASDFDDIFEDGEPYYCMVFATEEYEVYAEIYSYVYDGYLCAQICIYDNAD